MPGARFIINQIGYDARKMAELVRYMALRGLNVPAIANVFVLTATAARYFHAGKVPGVTVTDDLLALVEKHAASPDRGKSFLLELAAKQCAIARGIGYRGMYLGGHLRLEDYEQIFALWIASGRTTGGGLHARSISRCRANSTILKLTKPPACAPTRLIASICARSSIDRALRLSTRQAG